MLGWCAKLCLPTPLFLVLNPSQISSFRQMFFPKKNGRAKERTKGELVEKGRKLMLVLSR
jgi:hypothetical protein